MRKHTTLILFFTFLGGIAFTQTPSWKWVRSINGPSQEDEIDAVASDNNANVYISGKFEDSISFSGGLSPMISNGMADIMLIKYDSLGSFVWAKQFGGSGEDNVFDAVCDKSNNIILSGYFQQTIHFDTVTLTSFGGFDFFLVKLNPKGDVLWVKQFGGIGDEGGNEVAMAPHNRIIVSADSKGKFKAGSYTFNNTGNKDAYIISLDSLGSVNWIRSIQGMGTVRSKSVATDNAGNVYMGGDYLGPNGALDESSVLHHFTSSTSRDAYITAWSADGEFKWLKNWGGSSDEDYCKGIATNSFGDIFISGPFSKDITLGGQTIDIGTQINFYVWKLDSIGNSKWVRHLKSSKDILTGGEVLKDGNNGVLFGIGITDDLSLPSSGGASTQISLPSPMAYPIFVDYTQAGEIRYSKIADYSKYATFGEISRSGQYVFIDVPFWGITVFGNDTVQPTSLGNKDGGIVCLRLPNQTSGIKEKNKSNLGNFNLFPNPNNGLFTVQFSANSIKNDVVSIYDMQGRVVKQVKVKLDNYRIQIDVQSLKNGVYFLRYKNLSRLFIKR